MYTVMIADDGMFSAEYVVPPALSIPLGTSGSAVDVVRNEDGTFSADGEVITAETRVTAANGNVYAAVLSPEGVPVSAMHVAAMQDVMLGELGGTVKLTQAEDMSWWLGETAVADGSVHTHENGNMYTLMMDAEGMWSAMYKKVEVIVQLGTQHPITLERDEDMSWRLGSEAVDVGSEVMSESGNTYTLWYADGVWSAQFEPESMMIEGTGLVAMTKEDLSGYDVDGEDLPSDLPALGTDIDTSMGSYRVTMSDGMLMGTRLDPVAIDTGAQYKTDGLSAFPTILPDEDDTEDINEGMTALTIDGEDHPFSALLGSGMSEKQGANFVASARKELMDLRAKLEAILDVFETTEQKEEQVQLLWGNDTGATREMSVKKTLEKTFGTIPGFYTDEENTTVDTDMDPDADEALSKIDDLIMALSSVDGLEAALGDDGALKDLEVDNNEMSAAAIFDATESESTVSYGVTGMTRYGAVSKKIRDTAVAKAIYDHDSNPDEAGLQRPEDRKDSGELGAFGFSVTDETTRTRYVASAGNAYYDGGTLAVDQGGTHYSGDISIRVRFATDKVDGLITNLVSEDGDPWVHGFDDVSSISLPTATLNSSAIFSGSGSGNDKTGANISYALRAGSSAPTRLTSSWQGRLLGTGSDAGYQAVGQWSVGEDETSDSYLAGGFGAERVADEPDRRPALDDGTGVKTEYLGDGGAFAGDDTATDPRGGTGTTTLADGTLTVTVGKFGWTQDTEGSYLGEHTWERLPDGDTDDGDLNDGTMEYKISLAAVLAKSADGVEFNENGAIHRAEARKLIEVERTKLAVLIETNQLGGEGGAQQRIWENVQEILMTRIFNADDTTPGDSEDPFAMRLPDKVSGTYDKDTALETIDDIIWALSSSDNLESAFDKQERALFVEDDADFMDGRTAAQIYGEKELQVKAWIGTTDFTRFGVWRVQRTRSGARANGTGTRLAHGERDSFAYSPLDMSKVTSPAAPNYPGGASATYQGSTVAYVHGSASVGNGNGGGTPTGYVGDVDVHVTWTPEVIGGTVTTIISNLAHATNGDTLFHNDGTDNRAVREIVFEGEPIQHNVDGGTDNVLRFGDGDATASIRYAGAFAGSATPATAATLDGVFVGSSSDGPLGVLGRYTVNGAFRYSDDDTDSTGGGVGTVNRNITGAFGADLP